MILELKRALELLKISGWVGPEMEPMCMASDGGWCFENYPGVARFSVPGVLLVTGCYPEGWNALEAVVAPAWSAWNRFVDGVGAPTKGTDAWYRDAAKLYNAAQKEKDMGTWLKEPTRVTSDVLRAFVRAIERSKKTGERR